MGSPANTGRVVVRDEEGNEHLLTIAELLCAGGAVTGDRASYDKRVLAAIRRGIDTEVALLEIIGGERKDVRASLASHLEAGKIAKDGDSYSIAKRGTSRKGKSGSKKSTTKATSKKTSAATKTTSKKTAKKAQTKRQPKATTTQAKRQPKAKTEREPAARPKTPKLDTPQKREDFDAATLRAVEEGALTNSSVRKLVGGSALQVTAALGRLVAAGKLVVAAEGPPARYMPASAVSRGDEKKAKKPKLPRLKWTSTSRKGRKGYSAPWDTGEFKILETKTGSFALFFQRDEANYEEYGCGTSREAKKQARMIAAAGVPSAKQWHAQGGKLLGDCPVAVRRVTKSESATLTWTETIQDGRQVCVAPTADGEFHMESTDGGSFALVFVRDGDKSAEALGSGKKSTLLKRALEIVDEEAKDAAAYDSDSTGSKDTETADDDGADAAADAEADDAADGADDADAAEDDGNADADDADADADADDDTDEVAYTDTDDDDDSQVAADDVAANDAVMMKAFMESLKSL